MIPQALDSGLIKDAGKVFGKQLDEPLRHAIRKGFWEGFREVPSSPLLPDPAGDSNDAKEAPASDQEGTA